MWSSLVSLIPEGIAGSSLFYPFPYFFDGTDLHESTSGAENDLALVPPRFHFIFILTGGIFAHQFLESVVPLFSEAWLKLSFSHVLLAGGLFSCVLRLVARLVAWHGIDNWRVNGRGMFNEVLDYTFSLDAWTPRYVLGEPKLSIWHAIRRLVTWGKVLHTNYIIWWSNQ